MYQLLCMFGSHYPLIACGQVQGKFFKVIGLENGKGHYLRIIHLTPSLKLDSHACMLAYYMPAQPRLPCVLAYYMPAQPRLPCMPAYYMPAQPGL